MNRLPEDQCTVQNNYHFLCLNQCQNQGYELMARLEFCTPKNTWIFVRKEAPKISDFSILKIYISTFLCSHFVNDTIFLQFHILLTIQLDSPNVPVQHAILNNLYINFNLLKVSHSQQNSQNSALTEELSLYWD